MSSPSDSELSRRGTYRLMHPLGSGGFGTVWRAELLGAEGFRKPVAIKLLNAKGADDPELERRLRDEARVLGMIRHRAVVGVDDLVRVGERWAVVMEYVPGVDLEALIRQGPLPPRVAAEVIREAASALDAAHHARHPDTGAPLSVVHRDIKPANIRLTPAGEVKVLDFGIARARFDAREARTSSMRFGTPGYIAPERYDGEDYPPSDLFSLGAVLLECLVASWLGPLSIREAKFNETIEAKLNELPESLGALRQLISEMLAYEMEARPSADEVVRRLQDLVAKLPGPWLRDWARAHVKAGEGERSLEPLEGFMGLGGMAPESTEAGTWSMDSEDLEARPGTLVPATQDLAALLEPSGPRETLAPAPPTAVPLTTDLSEPAAPSTRPPWGLALVGAGVALLAALMWAQGGGDVPDSIESTGVTENQGARVGEPVAEVRQDAPEPLDDAPPSEPAVDAAPMQPPEDDRPPQPRPSHEPEPPPPDAEPAPQGEDAPSFEVAVVPPASVKVEHDGSLSLIELFNADGQHAVPGQVPAGSYGVRFSFGGEPMSYEPPFLVLEEGQTKTLFCDGRRLICGVR